MRLPLLVFSLLLSIALAAPPVDKPAPSQKRSVPAAKAQQSLTGCVDEQDGHYVLLDNQTMEKLVTLEAVGADNEAFFAKHVGHVVAVKGNKTSGQEGVLKVTSIERVAGECGPAPDKK